MTGIRKKLAQKALSLQMLTLCQRTELLSRRPAHELDAHDAIFYA